MCACGACRSCREDARFERVFRDRHGGEERLYYLERASRSPIGSSWQALLEARIYPFGRPRVRRRRKEKTQP
jgi:hypothetical protein